MAAKWVRTRKNRTQVCFVNLNLVKSITLVYADNSTILEGAVLELPFTEGEQRACETLAWKDADVVLAYLREHTASQDSYYLDPVFSYEETKENYDG